MVKNFKTLGTRIVLCRKIEINNYERRVKMRRFFIILIVTTIGILTLVSCSKKQERLKYPRAKKVNVVDNYFGTKVADPYRWMEDINSPEVKKWIEEEKKLTDEYFSRIPFRDKIRKRLTELWNYEKYSMPSKVGDYYVFSYNSGLQEQSVVYVQKGLDGKPEVLLDPNKFSKDNSVILTGLFFSHDNKYFGYSISRGGSDWREFFVVDFKTRKPLPDHLKWIKFSGMAWYKNGFFYSRYDKPKKEEALKQANLYQKVYYHRIGTPQEKDILVYQDKGHPKRGFGVYVTPDEKYLILNVWESSSTGNRLYYKDLTKKNSEIVKLIDNPDAHFSFIAAKNGKFYILTDYKAPNYKLVLIDLNNPTRENWKDVIPEGKDRLEDVSYVGGKLFAMYLKDANSKVSVFTPDGKYLYDVELPGIGTVYGFRGKLEDKETFYTFTSFTYPPTIYRYDIEKNKSTLFKKSKVKFNPEDYVTKEVFYTSKDGTRVPLFIVHKKGLKLDGKRPTLLYGYGGFDIPMRPGFRVTMLPVLENDGVYAMACIRGGGEYGEKWHRAGMLENKQNVFDDFIAAAEYLINNNYTDSDHLAIFGGSNGGLLIGAVINQRPELFKVAIAAVGVMDMLRYQKFTIGWAWVSEYGSSDNPEQFKYLIKYSPLHNIKEGLPYPAVLVTTADHDDRVFPAHSFKYIATLQEKYKGPNPVLIRIETKAGHGGATGTTRTINYYTDILSFMFYNMGIEPYKNMK